jgi:pteridine reductase
VPTTPNHKTALVTGSGARRVGNAVARALALRGYSIAVHYNHSADEAKKTVDQLRSLGVDAEAFAADVSRETSIDQLVSAILDRFGRIDVLVTCASTFEPKPLEAVTAEDVRWNFEVNTLGTFLCCQKVGLAMCEQPEGGAIVTVGDWATERPYRDYIAYLVSKGAIPTLTRALAVELAARNPAVRVNCILPGPVMMPPELTSEERATAIARTLVGHEGSPENVAHAVVFLVENEFVTGACLPVDGGRTIWSAE